MTTTKPSEASFIAHFVVATSAAAFVIAYAGTSSPPTRRMNWQSTFAVLSVIIRFALPFRRSGGKAWMVWTSPRALILNYKVWVIRTCFDKWMIT